jgi:hypothetical protein
MECDTCKEKANSGETKRGSRVKRNKRIGYEESKIVSAGLEMYT